LNPSPINQSNKQTIKGNGIEKLQICKTESFIAMGLLSHTSMRRESSPHTRTDPSLYSPATMVGSTKATLTTWPPRPANVTAHGFSAFRRFQTLTELSHDPEHSNLYVCEKRTTKEIKETIKTLGDGQKCRLDILVSNLH
jgi:hypothetical protein